MLKTLDSILSQSAERPRRPACQVRFDELFDIIQSCNQEGESKRVQTLRAIASAALWVGTNVTEAATSWFYAHISRGVAATLDLGRGNIGL